MNNGEVCKYIENPNSNKSLSKDKYIADTCVEEGVGQTCGGYFALKHIKLQSDHFLSYYNTRKDKKPSYCYLRCPQLLLFIAEIAGVPREVLESAYQYLKQYETDNNLIGKNDKNGNYIWGKQVFRDFKRTLKIAEVNKCIQNASNWNDVIIKVNSLFKHQ